MATIKTAIQIYDGITSPLMSMINSIQKTTNVFESMQKTSEHAVDTASIETARNEIDKATIAVQQLDHQLSNIPSPDINPKVNIPTVTVPIEPVWNDTGNIEIFNGSGIERYTQEIQSATDMMNHLANVQNQISTQATNTNIFPEAMVSDITRLNDRVERLRIGLAHIENNPIDDIGANKANNSVEMLRGQLNQAVKSQNTLTIAMRNMDISTANDAYKQLNNQIDAAEINIRDNILAQQQLNDTINQGSIAADGFGRKIKTAVSAFLGVAAMKKGINVIGDWLGLSDVQTRAETQLKTVMGQRMGTIDIQAVLDTTSLQQSMGVVGDEIQLLGAQQMATFLNSESALQTLLPAMNNLAVQQNGVAVSGENMVNIGNMMGKVMQGQTGALTRVGITFTEAQEKVLKYGDELERADMLAQIITDNVGNMNEAMANTPEGQIKQMSNTWGDIKETIGTYLYPTILKFFKILKTNMSQGEALMMGIASAAIVIMGVLGKIINIASAISGVFIDNWSMIAPLVLGIATAMLLYNAALIANSIIQGINTGIQTAQAIAIAVKTKASIADVAATKELTVAQWALNSAFLASPITWIIAGIIALIAVFYAVIAAVNHFAGTSLSATGIIMGAFATVGAFIGNIFMGLLEIAFGVIEYWYNWFAAIANFIGNIFNDPIAAVINLFADLADNVLNVLQKIAKAMDFVFKTNMADTIGDWRADLKVMAETAVNEYGNGTYQERIPELDIDSALADFGLKMEGFNYGNAYDTGYNFGKNIESKFNLDDASSAFDTFEISNALDGIYNGVNDTAGNTAKTADAMNANEEELKYMRDLAEQEVINRFTTAEIKVEMKNDMNVNNDLDLDGVVAHLEEKVQETMMVAAEGVHT